MYKQLSNAQKSKLTPLISGYKVRRALRKAKSEFQSIMKNIEGNNAKLTWKNMFQFVVELPIVTDNVIDAEQLKKLQRIQQLRQQRRVIKEKLSEVKNKIANKESELRNIQLQNNKSRPNAFRK